MRKGLAGSVHTVLGPIEPHSTGITLPHEHCYMDLSFRFVAPTEATMCFMAHQPVTWDNVWHVRYHPTRNADNLRLSDEALIQEEVRRFKHAGGGTIVDMSNVGLGRDPLALARLSRATGVHIVMGSGYYVDSSIPRQITLDECQVSESIVRDIVEGVDDTGIAAGQIGEIGCSWPITPNEEQSLRAAARAQQETGAPINVHPGFSPEAPYLAVRLLEGAGADLSRVAISHVEARIFEVARLLELAATGVMMEFDLFGVEGYQPIRMVYSEDNPLPAHMPNDGTRVEIIRDLVAAGYEDQILVSHDICWKTRFCRYGGHGYAHIIFNVVPLMKEKGLSVQIIDKFLVHNPARLLTFV